MAHETIDGTYRQTNLRNESPEYLRKREELRLAEIELLNQRERVAALRRQLPPGATLQDYELLEGAHRSMRVTCRSHGRGDWDASLGYGTEVRTPLRPTSP